MKKETWHHSPSMSAYTLCGMGRSRVSWTTGWDDVTCKRCLKAKGKR